MIPCTTDPVQCAVVLPMVISREIYLHDDVTFFAKMDDFRGAARCVWSRRPDHFILDATSKPKDRKKSLVIEI